MMSQAQESATSQTFGNAEVHEVLRAEPGVLVNDTGAAQQDLSIRGSSYSGAGLSLGGLTLRNAQSDHLNSELPLPAVLLMRPQIRTGLDNQGGHSVGTVNFDLLPITGTKQVEAGFGTDDANGQRLLAQHLLSGQLGMSVFAGRASANSVDDAGNDIDRETVGGHVQYREDETQVDTVVSHQQKKFGANGYYGVEDSRQADEKIDDTLMYLAARNGELTDDYLRGGIAWRNLQDDYEVPSWNINQQTESDTGSAFFDGRTLEVNGWALGWRADADHETVTRTHTESLDRTRGGLSLLPQWQGDRLKITPGLRTEAYTDESEEFLPQLGADYRLTDNMSAFAAYTETVQQPSYTDLYGKTPTYLGDDTLAPQTEQQSEIGLKGTPSEHTDYQLSTFHRRSHHTIDWTQATANAPWTAEDIGSVDLFGTETKLGWYPSETIESKLAYTWIYKDKTSHDLDDYASRYALDYPEHLAQLALSWRPLQALEIGTAQSLRWQTDNAARSGSDFGTDSSFIVRITPPKYDYATLTFLLRNAWNDDFQPVPDLDQPEQFAGASLTLTW